MEDRLSRWSRLKREAEQGAPPEPVEAVEPAEMPPQTPETPPEVLEANRAAAEAVDPAAIDETTDMGVFEREGVPEWLKQRAFAALWRSNPVFANVDGLNDYDEDFARPDLIMTTFKSAWQAGRGYLEELVEDAEGVEAEGGEAARAEPDTGRPEPVPATEPVALASAPDVAGGPGDMTSEPAPPDEPDAEPLRVPLRARLTFD